MCKRERERERERERKKERDVCLVPHLLMKMESFPIPWAPRLLSTTDKSLSLSFFLRCPLTHIHSAGPPNCIISGYATHAEKPAVFCMQG